MAGMKVYVAESGCYENRAVSGIFDTAERAMAAMPGNRWTLTFWNQRPFGTGFRAEWQNDLHDDSLCAITEMELTTDGPSHVVDEIRVQNYVSGREWSYDPIGPAEAADLLR